MKTISVKKTVEALEARGVEIKKFTPTILSVKEINQKGWEERYSDTLVIVKQAVQCEAHDTSATTYAFCYNDYIVQSNPLRLGALNVINEKRREEVFNEWIDNIVETFERDSLVVGMMTQTETIEYLRTEPTFDDVRYTLTHKPMTVSSSRIMNNYLVEMKRNEFEDLRTKACEYLEEVTINNQILKVNAPHWEYRETVWKTASNPLDIYYRLVEAMKINLEDIPMFKKNWEQYGGRVSLYFTNRDGEYVEIVKDETVFSMEVRYRAVWKSVEYSGHRTDETVMATYLITPIYGESIEGIRGLTQLMGYEVMNESYTSKKFMESYDIENLGVDDDLVNLVRKNLEDFLIDDLHFEIGRRLERR